METALLELCFLAGAIASTTRVALSAFDRRKNVINPISHTSGRTQTIDGRFALQMLTKKNNFLLVKDVPTHPDLANHPITEHIPHLRSLACYWLHEKNDIRYLLTVVNPSQDFFENHFSITAMDHIVGILTELVSNKQTPDKAFQLPEAFSKAIVPPPSTLVNHEPASRFLIDTLMRKQRLLARNGCSYLALRQWRKSIKPYQLSALTALKATPEPRFDCEIGGELTAAILKVYGNAFQSVVPVPPGSSGQENGMSVRLARHVAQRLKIPMIEALEAPRITKGASHPKKSAALQPYKIKAEVKGNILIIDDVAISGRHIELATNALRPLATYCTTLVWIAD